MTDRRPTVAGRVALLIRAGLIAGLVIAGLSYPFTALAGMGVKAGTDALDNMPEQLTEVPAAQTTYVYAKDGKTLLTMFYEEYRRQVPLKDMSPYITQAIVASEDTRFYEHHGVDAKGVARAFVANQQAGGVSQGASTLTMQYVRMALRDSAKTPKEALEATEQTAARKLREMRLAVEVEQRLSKQEILQRYLNAAYFGHRAYGIYAASEVFFSKPAKDLTLNEAALLAGLVKAPSAYDPATRDQDAALQRRNYVVDQMLKMGSITEAQATAAKKAKIKLRLSTPPNDCVSVSDEHNDWGFFCDYFKNWWREQPAFGRNVLEREENLRRGGYRVVTTIDPAVQGYAIRHVLDKEGRNSPFAHGEVVIEPGTGRVVSMAVNRRYSLQQDNNGKHSDRNQRDVRGNYPNTVNPLLGGGDMAGYQAGSTFKIFTLLAALDAGLPLSTSYYAPERFVSKYITAPGPATCGTHWCPKNSSKSMTGEQTMWSGFGKSVNTYFVQLEQRVGAEKAVAMAEKLGLKWRTAVDRTLATPEHAAGWGAFTLGVSDATPVEIANVFATVAAEGNYCEPLPVISIRTPDGRDVTSRGRKVADPRCHRVFSRDVARAATDAARCPTGYGAARGSCGGWGTSEMVYATMGRPVAGKSGTTDNNKTAWFSGFTPQLAASAFVADPDNPEHYVGSGRSTISKYTVAETLRDALKGRPELDFTPPSDKLVW
ncbi:glycosyl transferase [Actinoplanes sp. SE50]|uniref:transglycosylase domain-containing protein n=1 Tax=unclassified Actinoplanes TaxID=2626549 RepID=UPI00023ED1BB|nr:MULTISPECIES: transglycosylase domain-containing protein [unclassified Actinoplanes]AEV82200.1 glycosyl transferase family protein [Actinoplanes sp. SE50/110]ATO80599.1 glycosyl transferase [Actinoplanes sp. SE50]SLL98005.1 glycosyl transferase [Actinoplanes sp. SE50/110]